MNTEAKKEAEENPAITLGLSVYHRHSEDVVVGLVTCVGPGRGLAFNVKEGAVEVSTVTATATVDDVRAGDIKSQVIDVALFWDRWAPTPAKLVALARTIVATICTGDQN